MGDRNEPTVVTSDRSMGLWLLSDTYECDQRLTIDQSHLSHNGVLISW